MSLKNKNVFRRFFLKVDVFLTDERGGTIPIPDIFHTAIDMPVTGITYDVPTVQFGKGEVLRPVPYIRTTGDQTVIDGSAFSHSFNHVCIQGYGYILQVSAIQSRAYQDYMHDKGYIPEFIGRASLDPLSPVRTSGISNVQVTASASMLIEHEYVTSDIEFNPIIANDQKVVFFDQEQLDLKEPMIVHSAEAIYDWWTFKGRICVDSKKFLLAVSVDDTNGGTTTYCGMSPSIDFDVVPSLQSRTYGHVETAGPMVTWRWGLLIPTECPTVIDPGDPTDEPSSGCCKDAVKDTTVQELVEQVKLNNALTVIAMDTTIHPTARHLAALKALDSVSIKDGLTTKDVAQYSLTSLVVSAIASTSNQSPYMSKDPAKDNKGYKETPGSNEDPHTGADKGNTGVI